MKGCDASFADLFWIVLFGFQEELGVAGDKPQEYLCAMSWGRVERSMSTDGDLEPGAVENAAS